MSVLLTKTQNFTRSRPKKKASHRITFSLFFTQIPYEMARDTSEIPGPPIYPGIGSLLSLTPFGDLDFLKRIETAKILYDRYGPICKMKLPTFGGLAVFLFDPADFEKVYR